MNAVVSTRPVCLPEDSELLAAIYRSSRESEIAAFGWTEDELNAFLKFQFEAQTRYFADCFPNAEHSVVLVEGTPAGRLIVEHSKNCVHILDIALLPSFRRGGVGAELVHQLLDEAEGRGVPVTCQVKAGNQARRFWERLGFVAGRDNGAYIAMERPCATSRA